jgi:hypothetical protein
MIRLPRFTFLNAPLTAGKSTLATLLCDHDVRLAPMSFAEPIRTSLLSTFYPESMHFGIDLRDPQVKDSALPGVPMTHRQWMVAYGQWMKTQFGPNFWGDLAKRQTEKLAASYDRFIFDDCRYEGEIKPFGLGYGPEHCLIIRIERPNTQWDQPPIAPMMGIRMVSIRNVSDPISMARQLASILGKWSDNWPPPPAPEPEIDFIVTPTADILKPVTAPGVHEL